LSVAVRWKPVMTVVNGTLVARPASTTMLRAWPGGDGSQLVRRGRSVLGDYHFVGKSPEGLAVAVWGA
jgi:hypothetical protein